MEGSKIGNGVPAQTPKEKPPVIKTVKYPLAPPQIEPSRQDATVVAHKSIVEVKTQVKSAKGNQEPIKFVDTHHAEIHADPAPEGHGAFGKAREEAMVKTAEKIAITMAEVGERVAIGTAGAIAEHVATELPKTSSKAVTLAAKSINKMEGNAAGRILLKAPKAVGHAAEHTVERIAEATAAKTIEKVGEKVATKTTARILAHAGTAVPYIGTAAGVVITGFDLADAMEKTKDKSVGKVSAGFAWATVGLDIVATGAQGLASASASTIIGAPVALVSEGVSLLATVGSIATSAVSELTR